MDRYNWTRLKNTGPTFFKAINFYESVGYNS